MKSWTTAISVLIAAAFSCMTASAQGTYTAVSCQYSDVNAVVNGPTHKAVDGDTIQIPAGSCTWTSPLVVPTGIGITVVGSGSPNSTPSTNGASASCSSTVISDSLTSGYLFQMKPTVGNSVARISCLKLLPTLPRTGYNSPIDMEGTCNSGGCPHIRLDNITAPSSWAAIGISDDTFAVVANVFGVADHNTIGDVQSSSNGVDFINVAHGNWQGRGSWGDNSWASPDTFGTDQAFYLENNIFNWSFGTDADRYGTQYGGGRFVCRFNTFNHETPASACTNHGTDTIARTRGGRQLEFYGNTIASCQNSACNTVVGSRGGTALVFGNTFNGGFTNSYFATATKRKWATDSWGPCDGSSVWDTNDGTVYYSGTVGAVGGSTGAGYFTITPSGTSNWTASQWYLSGDAYSFHDVTRGWGYEIASNTSSTLTTATNGGGSGNGSPSVGDSFQILRASVCMDQVGRGAGLLVVGGDGTVSTDGFPTPRLASTGSPGPVNQALVPIYEFADSGVPAHNEVSADSSAIIANRDFYAQKIGQTAQTSPTSPFNGTSGTGYGTLANRPTTCTPNVGYWATDQGSWNQSGNAFGQGQLFVCTATNSWTLYYTPYTYPHPVTTGAQPQPPPSGGGTTPVPTGLVATAH